MDRLTIFYMLWKHNWIEDDIGWRRWDGEYATFKEASQQVLDEHTVLTEPCPTCGVFLAPSGGDGTTTTELYM